MHRKFLILVSGALAATSLACAVSAPHASEPSKWPQTSIPKPPPRETVRLRVTQGLKHQPVVGARVRWAALNASGPTYAVFAASDPNAPYSLLDGALVEATTDERGEVELGLGGKHLVVEASAGTGWDWALCDVDWLRDPNHAEPLELQLVPDFDVSVCVLDSHGQPAVGAPVCIRSGEGLGAYDCRTWLSDDQGRVTIRHAGNAMHASYFSDERGFSVAVAGCLIPPVASPIDRDQPPAGQIELRLPPTGEVQLVYEELDGTPIPMFGIAGLDMSVDPESTRATRLPSPPTETYREAGVAAADAPGTSEVTIRYVSLGSQWTAYAQRNQLSEPSRAEVRGPQTEGERVRIVLHPPAVALVQGQLTDERGNPRAGVEVSARTLETPPSGGWNYANAAGDWVQQQQLGSEWGHRDPPRMKADASGKFRIDVDRTELKGSEHYLLLMEHQGEARELSALGEIEAKPSAAKVDLGRLRLAPSPVIAAGTIKDEAGRPLEGVLVGLWDNPRNMFWGRDGLKSGADGSFVIRGVKLDEHVKISFHGEGLIHWRDVETRPGKQNLDVRMERAGRIRGRVQPQEGVAPSKVCVRWMALTGTYAEERFGGSRYRDCAMKEDWSFEVADLPAGAYRLSVWSPGFPNSEAIVRTGVRVDPEVITELGEIAPLTAGKKITLRVLGPDGAAPKTGIYVVNAIPATAPVDGQDLVSAVDCTDAWRSTARHLLNAGAIDVYTKGCIESLQIAVPGCRLERQTNILESTDIHLRAGLPIKIQLRKRVGALPEGRVFRLGLVSIGGPPRTSRRPSLYQSEPFDESGTAMLFAPDPGKYWIQWIVERSGSSPRIFDDPDQQLPIADVAEEQSFVLEAPIDPASRRLDWW